MQALAERSLVPVATFRADSSTFALTIGAVTTCALAWRRWNAILDPQPLEVDESAMVARAMKAALDPVPWRSYDGTTSGPLDTLALAAPRLVGVPIGYFEARLLALVLVAATLTAWFTILARLVGRRAALAGTLGPCLFFTLTDHLELTTFASELLPIALLAFAGLALANALSDDGDISMRHLSLGVFLAAAAPWAKLQVAPMAFVLFILSLAIVGTRHGAAATARERLRRALVITGFACIPTAAFLTIAATTRTLRDFSISYILESRAYVRPAVISPITFFFATPWTGPWYVGMLAAIILFTVIIASTIRKAPSDSRTRTLLTRAAIFAALTLASIASVIAPQRAYEHYLLLPLLPSSGLAAALACIAVTLYEELGRPRASRALSLLAIVAPTIGPLWCSLNEPNAARWALPDRGALRNKALTGILRCALRPGDDLAIWGFAPDAYVATGAVPATRDAIAQFQIDPGPFQRYYRARFLADLRRTQPNVFVEAIGPKAFLYHDRSAQGIASFAELSRYIARYSQRIDLGDAVVFVRLRTQLSSNCMSAESLR